METSNGIYVDIRKPHLYPVPASVNGATSVWRGRKEALWQGPGAGTRRLCCAPPRRRGPGAGPNASIASAIAERQGVSVFPTARGADKTSDSGDKYFGCSTVTFLPHSVGNSGSVSSSTTCDSFKANVAWEEFCVLRHEAAGSI